MVLIKMYERLAVVFSYGIADRFVYHVICDISQVLCDREYLLEDFKLTFSLLQLVNETLSYHLLCSLCKPRQLDQSCLHLLIVSGYVASLVRAAS
jgi:hypothetical protein